MTPDDIARFNAKVDRSGGPDACWPWTAGKFKSGYGSFWVNGKTHRAHRIAYELHYGPLPRKTDPTEPTIFVCHHCDNPPCCNPACLFAGTTTDNIRDAARKGRLASGDANGARLHPERHSSRLYPESRPRGESHYSRKLLPDTKRIQIAHIFELRAQGLSRREIGAGVGLNYRSVCRILSGKQWPEITAHLREDRL